MNSTDRLHAGLLRLAARRYRRVLIASAVTVGATRLVESTRVTEAAASDGVPTPTRSGVFRPRMP